MKKSSIKSFVANHSICLSKIYNILCFNRQRINGKGNSINKDGAFMRRCIIRVDGNNNILVLNAVGGGNSFNRFDSCFFNVIGSNNVIEIGTNSTLLNVSFTMHSNNNEIRIGRNFDCHSSTELAALEGTKIIIGRDALFSANIKFRTGDSHIVLNAITGERTNISKDIILGEHVWVGNSVTILKGAEVGDHSIIAIESVVTGKKYPSNCVIGGNPAKVLKENVDWQH